MSTPELTVDQLHALFDILTHYETYAEILDFRFPTTVTRYGPPFNSKPGEEGEPLPAPQSNSPILQALLSKFVLTLPGMVDLPPEFWNVRAQGILARFAEVNLSESYDKGAMGTRKTLATAASAIIEGIARGVLGGYPGRFPSLAEEEGQSEEAIRLVSGFEGTIKGIIHGGLVDELFAWVEESEDVEAFSPEVKGAIDYCIIHLATFLHQVFVLSPEGEYLLKLIENANRLVPYSMVKQTLRVSNAATMISAMVRLLLAKLSLTSLSNWAGLTANPDDGMNLLQRIISMVLSWDGGEFKKSADKIEKAKDRPSEEHLIIIREHLQEPREAQEQMRQASIQNNQSIIAALFAAKNIDIASLSDVQHTQCLEYYSALLSVRDREEITSVLCRLSPDLFTQMIRECFAAFDPMIRKAHNEVDLREYVETTRVFMDDFLKTSKYGGKPQVKGSGWSSPAIGVRPTVDDYVDLIRRHRKVLYKWLHEIASKCPDIREDYHVWANTAFHAFRGYSPRDGEASLQDRLQGLFVSVPDERKGEVCAALDAHKAYLKTLEEVSFERMQTIAGGSSGCMLGTGMYLARWQALLDDTLITPETVVGEVRKGKEVKDATTKGKVGASVKGLVSRPSSRPGSRAGSASKGWLEDMPAAPDVSVVTVALGGKYREMLAEMRLDRS